MREIKFRAWYRNSMRFFDKPEDFKWFFCGNDGPERTLTSCELMQYTGLKDKNGKEIYEGDILKAIHSSKLNGVHSVVWHNNGFVIEYKFMRTYEGSKYEEKTTCLFILIHMKLSVIFTKINNPHS